jgi:hypothetical protein
VVIRIMKVGEAILNRTLLESTKSR